MTKEINFKIEVRSETDYQKILEILKVRVANMELAGTLKILSLGTENKQQELVTDNK